MALIVTIVLFETLGFLSDFGVLDIGSSNFLGWTLPMIFVFVLGIIITLALFTTGFDRHARKATVGVWSKGLLTGLAAIMVILLLLLITWVIYGTVIVPELMHE